MVTVSELFFPPPFQNRTSVSYTCMRQHSLEDKKKKNGLTVLPPEGGSQRLVSAVVCTMFQRINPFVFTSRCVFFFGWLAGRECVYVGGGEQGWCFYSENTLAG